VTGVEPAETRFGDECLTVWRHPYILKKAERVGVEPTEGVTLTHLANERTRPLCDLSVLLRTYYAIYRLGCQPFLDGLIPAQPGAE
jgi:hypothetical protein